MFKVTSGKRKYVFSTVSSRRRRRFVRPLLALLVLFGGCGSEQSSDCPARPVLMKSPSPTEPAYCQNFSSTLVMRDALGREVNQFSLGEPISFESNVTNNGASPVTLTKANGCPQIAFEAYSTAGTIVWSSADGVACTQATEAVTYAPGETKTFSGQWNQRACNAQSAAGSYRIRTQDTTECWARIDRDLPFTLQ